MAPNSGPGVAANPYASPKTAYYALGLLTVVYSFNFIDRQLLAILQESIKADLSLSDSQLGLLTGFAFAVFYVTAGIPIARWADHSNRRNIVALALFLWSFMTALSGLAQNYIQLLLARIGVGVGEAGGSPPSHSIISDIFPAGKRASALGFYSTGVSFGILFGFLFGGWLNEFFGWRVAFFVVGAPGIALALLVRHSLREPLRGMAEQRTVSSEAVTIRQVITLLWSRLSFRHLASNSHYGNGQSLHALIVVETSQTRSGNEPQYRFLCLVGARNGRDNFRSIRPATKMRIAATWPSPQP